MNYLKSPWNPLAAQSENLETLEPGNRCYRPILKPKAWKLCKLACAVHIQKLKILAPAENHRPQQQQKRTCSESLVCTCPKFLSLAFSFLWPGFRFIGWHQTHPGKVFPAQFSDPRSDCLQKRPLGHSLKYTLTIFLDVSQSSQAGNQY